MLVFAKDPGGEQKTRLDTRLDHIHPICVDHQLELLSNYPNHMALRKVIDSYECLKARVKEVRTANRS
jgi:hypothetical protein